MDSKTNIIERYYDSAKYRNACKSWKDVTDWEELCNNMILFLNGVIDMPGYKNHMGSFQHETSEYQNILRYINKCGLLTTDSQPAMLTYKYRTGELINIKREYIQVSLPNVNLNEFVDKLLNYNVFVAVVRRNDVVQLKDEHHLFGFRNESVLNGIDILCDIFTGSGLSEADLWGKYSSEKPKRSFKIPLTLRKYTKKPKTGLNYYSKHAIDPCDINNVPLKFITRWDEIDLGRKQFILSNVSTVWIFDPDWDNKSYKILNIVREIAASQKISNISMA